MKNHLMIGVLAVTLSAFFNTALAEDAPSSSCKEIYQNSLSNCKMNSGCTSYQREFGQCDRAQLEACYAQAKITFRQCLHPQQVKNP